MLPTILQTRVFIDPNLHAERENETGAYLRPIKTTAPEGLTPESGQFLTREQAETMLSLIKPLTKPGEKLEPALVDRGDLMPGMYYKSNPDDPTAPRIWYLGGTAVMLLPVENPEPGQPPEALQTVNLESPLGEILQLRLENRIFGLPPGEKPGYTLKVVADSTSGEPPMPLGRLIWVE